MELTLIPNEEKKKILSLLDFSNLDKWVTYFHKPGTYTTQSSLVTSATKKAKKKKLCNKKQNARRNEEDKGGGN